MLRTSSASMVHARPAGTGAAKGGTAAGHGARGALGVLFVVALFNYVDRSLLSILQVPIKAELGLSDAALGALTGLAFGLVYATAALPLSQLVDRGRRVLILAAALVAWSAMTGLTGLAGGFVALILFRTGVALGEAVSVPATHSLLSDYYPLRTRGRVFAIWALASPLGVMLGVFLGGALEQTVGWRLTFAVVGLTGLLVTPLLLMLPEPARGQSDESPRLETSPPRFRAAVKLLWSIGSFRLLVAATTFQAFSHTAMLNWAPAFYARVHAMPLSEVAIWTALMIGLAGGAGALVGGTLVDHLTRKDRRWYGWAPGLAILISVPLGLGQYLAPLPAMALPLSFLTLFFANTYIAPINAAAQSLVPPTMRGFTAAVLLFVPTLLGVGLGSFTAGLLSDAFASNWDLGDQSLRYALAVVLLASVGAGALLIRMGACIPRDLAKAAAAAG